MLKCFNLINYRLTQAACSSRRRSTPSASEEDSEDDDADLDEAERAKRREFKNRRKMHYNEFKAVQMARKLIAEEEDDDDDEETPSSEFIIFLNWFDNFNFSQVPCRVNRLQIKFDEHITFLFHFE